MRQWLVVAIDGSNETFNVGAIVHAENTGGFHTLSLLGLQSAGSANSILMSITTSAPITAGTYTGGEFSGQHQLYVNFGRGVPI
jgi:hypothetical protein